MNIYDIPLKRIDATPASLGDYKGKAMLIVNVASKCGLTPQYEGLEKLYKNYRDKGFVVVGFPANDFAGQEPGTNEEIQQFCTINYGVDFPMFEKITVTGEGKHPLYAALIAAHPERKAKPDGTLRARLDSRGLGPKSETEVMWNFEKFLVDRAGRVVARFAPDIAPDDPALTSAVESELAKSA